MQSNFINQLTLICCSGQVVLCLWTCYRYLLPLNKRLRVIRDGVQVVATVMRETEDPSVQRSEVGTRLLSGAIWAMTAVREFIATWRESRLAGEDRAAFSVRLRSFLTPRVVIATAANQRTSEALPGFFIALGIFGTFLGLVLGLSGQGLQTGADENVLSEVRKVVAGLQLAFITSLIGIFSSITFSWWHRGLLRRIEDAVRALDDAVAQVYPCASEEYYGRKFLEHQGDIKAQMQTLATDIALHVSRAIGGAVEEMDKKQSEAVKDMGRDMLDLIRETTAAQASIRQEMTEFSERLQRQFAVQSELIDKTSRASELLGGSMESLGVISRDFQSAATDVSAAANLLGEAARQTKEGQESLWGVIEGQKEAMDQTRSDLEASWQTISSGTTTTVQHIRTLIDHLAESLGENLTKALGSFDDKLAEVVGRFSGTLFDTKSTIEELPGLLGTLSGSIDSISTHLESYGKVMEGLRETSERLVAPNIQLAHEAAAKLATTAEGSWNAVDALNSSLSRASDRFEAIASAMDSRGTAGAGRGAEAALAGDGKIAETLQGVSGQLADIKGSVEGAATQLAALVRELRALAERPPAQVHGGTDGKEVTALLGGLESTSRSMADSSAAIQATVQGLGARADEIAITLSQLKTGPEGEQGKKGFLGGLFGR
ncbi:MAG: MotA/TolQ/ExbB proton channel family protein [Deferrisomatales bacterium]